MKKIIISLMVSLVVAANAQAADKLKVVTSHRILQDWVQEIGKEHVQVESLYNGKRNIHFFEPRPSNIKKVAQADALVIAGLDGDPWMPELIAASRNPQVQYGALGLIDPSVNILVLEKPSGTVNMSMGDVHPYGNPHFQFYKEDVLTALDNIEEGLSKLRPGWKEDFQKNSQEYKDKVSAVFDRLTQNFLPYSGTKAVTYHKSWEYFAKQFGLNIVGELEPKPGIPPSPSHLAELVRTMKRESVPVIIAEGYFSNGPVETVSAQTGAKPVRLANYLGERKQDKTFLDLLENNISELIGVLSEK